MGKKRTHLALLGSGAVLFTVWGGMHFASAQTSSTATVNLDLSTYFGGSLNEHFRDVVMDAQGNMLGAGATTSPDYPVTPGTFQTSITPGTPVVPGGVQIDSMVTKFDDVGNVVWSSYLGGIGYDRAYAIETDANG